MNTIFLKMALTRWREKQGLQLCYYQKKSGIPYTLTHKPTKTIRTTITFKCLSLSIWRERLKITRWSSLKATAFHQEGNGNQPTISSQFAYICSTWAMGEGRFLRLHVGPRGEVEKYSITAHPLVCLWHSAGKGRTSNHPHNKGKEKMHEWHHSP